MNIFTKLFRRKKESLSVEAFTKQQAHIIAIARLSFIKPDVLVREAENFKANGEYLFAMIQALEELKHESISEKN